MLDKIEPPLIPDGYGISVAYACLLEIIRSLHITIAPQPSNEEGQQEVKPKEINTELHRQLINSSWCGLLTALTPLIDASTDEAVTENVLKAVQTYAYLCGLLDLQIPRDAFITAICKSSLPPHYALTVLNTVTPGGNIRHRGDGQDLPSQFVNQYSETDYRQQVVAVGTPLPTSSLPVGKELVLLIFRP